jgi:fatty acid amide hydrolase 2
MLATGPLARRSADLMPLLRVLAGPDGADPNCRDVALGDPASVRLDGLRVVDVPGQGRIAVDPQLRAAQQRVAAHLRGRGAEVVERSFPSLKASFDIWATSLGGAEGKGAFRKLMQRDRWIAVLPHLFWPAELGGTHTVPAVLLGLLEDVGSALPRRIERFQALRDTLRDEIVAAIGDHGVLLYPSYPRPAPRHREPWTRPFDWVYTAVFNALGLPVTQVPLGLDARGLPLGVQVVGKPGDDHVTIAVAEALERDGVAGWVPPPQ